MRPRQKLPVLMIVLLALPLGAEEIPDGAQVHIVVPASIDLAGLMRGSVVAEVTGDLRPDVVLLVGTTPYVVGSPSTFQVFAPLDPARELEANDLAVLPGAASYGLDLVLTVGSQGLQGWEYRPGGLFAATTIEGGAWLDARSVRTGDLDGDGRLDVVGLGADGRTVRALRRAEDGGYEPWCEWTLPPGTPDPEIEQIEIVRWVAGDEAQIAVQLAHELRVVDRTGGLVESFGTVGPSSLFEVVGCGEATDAIAWITRTPDLAQQWFALKKPGGASEPGFPLGLLGATGAARADIEPDGDDDIVLLHTWNPTFVVLTNRSGEDAAGGNHFGNSEGYAAVFDLGPAGTPMGAQLAQPVLADFDLDGDVDGVLPVQGSRTIVLQRSPLQSEAARRMRIAYSASNVVLTPSGFLFLPELERPEIEPLDATHLEYQFWQENAGGLVGTAPIHSGSIDLASVPPGPTIPLAAELLIPHAYAYPTLYLVARFVRRDADGVDRQAWLDTTWKFTEYDYTGGGIQGRSPVPDVGGMPPGSLPPPPPGSSVPPP